jgi:hypothetical protein
MEAINRRGTHPPPRAVQHGVRDALTREGERKVAERLGLSRLSVAKIAAGMAVHRGTAALAAARLGIEIDDA